LVTVAVVAVTVAPAGILRPAPLPVSVEVPPLLRITHQNNSPKINKTSSHTQTRCFAWEPGRSGRGGR